MFQTLTAGSPARAVVARDGVERHLTYR
jgi:hypothetical protein